LLLSQAFFGGNPFDGGILGFHGAFGYHEALSQTSPLSIWNFGCQVAFHKFFFRCGILAITKPFTRTFLFYDGILAITEPFHKYPFHTMEPSAITVPFHEFFFNTMNLGYHGAFSRIFL
jgi:hypothetical protein